jgi:hypothetical protein
MRYVIVAGLTVLSLAACETLLTPDAPAPDAPTQNTSTQTKPAQAAPPPATQPPPPPSAPKFTSLGLSTLKAADGATGSGCLPASGPLADGAWFGFAKKWNASNIHLDPACWYTGKPAAQVALARGEESPPPNDFFIANDGTAVRRIPVAPGASARRITHDQNGAMKEDGLTYAQMIANPGSYLSCPGEWCPVWVFVNGGVATEVTMQYVP